MSGVQANLLLAGVQNASPWLSTDELQAPAKLAMAQQRNALLNRMDEQTLAAQDMEMIARASAYLETLPDTAARQAAYPGVVSQLQGAGFAKNAPSVYPGHERISQLARMGTPSKELLTLSENRRAGQALLGTGTTPAAPATTGGAPGGGAATSLAIPGRGTGGPGAGATVPTEWLPYFYEASRETGIPVELLIAQARQESTFDPNAKGKAGEIGLFQIMPSTAQSPGFGLTGVDPATLTGPENVRNNILFGARYLRARGGQGDPNNPAWQANALRSYNAGGDPNYVANVNRYRPGLAPSDPAAAVTTYTPGGAPTGGVAARTGGTDVAGSPGTVPARPTGVVAPDGTTTTTTTQPPPAAVPGLLQLDQRGLTANDRSELGALVQSGRLAPTDLAAAIQQRSTANNAHNNQAIAQARAARGEERQLRTEERVATAAAAKEERERRAEEDPLQGKSEDERIERTLLGIAPKIKAGTATEEEIAQYDLLWNKYRDGPVQQVPDGKGGTMLARVPRTVPARFPPPPGQTVPAGPAAIPGTEKQPDLAPPAVVGGMLANATGMEKILKAQQELEQYSGAVGAKGNLPEFILQRADPEGVAARTAISNVGGHEFHDMSGAAISASEGRRLTYIPTTQDTEQAVKTKLHALLEDNREILLKSYRTYGPENNGRRLPEVEAAIVESIPEVAREKLKNNKDDPGISKQFDKVFGRGAAKLVLNYDG